MDQRRFPSKPIEGHPVTLVYPQGITEKPSHWEADFNGEVLTAESRLGLGKEIKARMQPDATRKQLDLLGE